MLVCTQFTAHKLCGARDAARLGFHLSSDIALSLKQLSRSVMILDKRRIVMELNHMLAFGSAEASFRLLWRFGLLKILIPVQVRSYAFGFDPQKLFANLDRLVTPKWPCDECICFAGFCVLAFHKALVDQSRDPFVVSAFGYAVHGHGNLDEAVKFGKTNSRHEQGFPENITWKKIPPSIAVKIRVINLTASVSTTKELGGGLAYFNLEALFITLSGIQTTSKGKRSMAGRKCPDPRDPTPLAVAAFGLAVHSGASLSLILQHQSMMQLRKMMDDCYVSRAMIEFSEATFSDLVFIPPETLQQVYEIFECIRRGMESGFVIDQDREIDYEPLAQGCLQEVRHVFGRIVFDTVYPPNKN
ncbi:polynucleotide adenylyltransferase family protein [Citrus sinensis]|nr:polynucleotide adenylyltransferase family protein [Citrus sinensis]